MTRRSRKPPKKRGTGNDIAYQVITDQIMALLEQGVAPWRKTWKGTAHCSSRGHVYRGINQPLLACTASVRGYTSNIWLTFKQARELGGCVRKGQKGTQVVFWKVLERKAQNAETGEQDREPFRVLRYYTVFNVDQCDGVTIPRLRQFRNNTQPIAECEAIIEGYADGPTVTHGGDRARYCPGLDRVEIPPTSVFERTEYYYGALFHELAHSTGHEKRLARPEIATPSFFDNHEYSREELIAEFAATFLCSRAGIEAAMLENAAAYIQHWLSELAADPKITVQAASAAQKAADFILGELPDEEDVSSRNSHASCSAGVQPGHGGSDETPITLHRACDEALALRGSTW